MLTRNSLTPSTLLLGPVSSLKICCATCSISHSARKTIQDELPTACHFEANQLLRPPPTALDTTTTTTQPPPPSYSHPLIPSSIDRVSPNEDPSTKLYLFEQPKDSSAKNTTVRPPHAPHSPLVPTYPPLPHPSIRLLSRLHVTLPASTPPPPARRASLPLPTSTPSPRAAQCQSIVFLNYYSYRNT